METENEDASNFFKILMYILPALSSLCTNKVIFYDNRSLNYTVKPSELLMGVVTFQKCIHLLYLSWCACVFQDLSVPVVYYGVLLLHNRVVYLWHMVYKTCMKIFL